MARHSERSRTARRLAAIVATSALLLGCGGDDDAADEPAPAAAPDDADSDNDDDGTDDNPVIVISGFEFTGPADVPAGTTVVVRNNDSAPHSWTSVDGVFDSGTLAMGESFEFTFDEPGEYPFFCAIHPSMTGTIVVTG